MNNLKLPDARRLLVAFSGGADSTALLDYLWQKRLSGELEMVAAGHFNHRLRAEADDDEQHVRAFCSSRGIPCFFGTADVAHEAKFTGTGLEATARSLRYEFLFSAAQQADAQIIVTAHTANDNVETVLLNLARGSGVAGLRGIPPQRGVMVRPMLGVTRAQVLDYLAGRSLGYVEDASNADTSFRRNRLRHDVIPVLREFNPRLEAAVCQTTSLLRQEEDFLSGLTAQAMLQAESCPEGVSFPCAELASLHPALGLRVCRAMAESSGLFALSYDHLISMLSLCQSESPHAGLDLPQGFVARRKYDLLILGPAALLTSRQSVTLLREEASPDGENVHKSFNTFLINADTIQGDLTVRSRQPGDTIALCGRSGSKTLKKLFIEEKIPVHLRDSVPVLADDLGVVAVCGFGVDRSRVAQEGSPALKITVRSEPI